MKKKLYLLIVLVFSISSILAQAEGKNTNDLFDNTPRNTLKMVELEVLGEVVSAGKVDFAKLPVRDLIAKEAVLKNGKPEFVGAYRYYGYSLYDIINSFFLKKDNEKEFHPTTDAYVEIYNAKGEKVVVSWSEIYIPNKFHRIILANEVSRIVPEKSKDQWPLSVNAKLVFGDDFMTHRNIDNPVKIVVKSYKHDFVGDKSVKNVFSPEIKLFANNKEIDIIKEIDKNLPKQAFPTTYYGRGMGFHDIMEFGGYLLKDVLKKYYQADENNIKAGLFVMSAKDGYRCVYSFSEIFNRNDQSEFLFRLRDFDDDGKFAIFPTPDFFSDRGLKAIQEIRFTNN